MTNRLRALNDLVQKSSGVTKGLSDEAHAQRSEQNILLGIRDDRIRAEVSRVLQRLGPQVASLADGYRVVEHIADAILDGPVERRPCLIIVDSILDGCTGLSLVSGLRELGWDTPVILLTPKDDEGLRRQAWEHGATGVFMAPFDARELCVFAELILDIGLRTGLPDPRRPRNRRAIPRVDRLGHDERVIVHG